MLSLIVGFFDPSITLGQVVQGLIIAAAAIWVGRKISRRNDAERSVRDLLVRICGDAMVALSALSLESETEVNSGKPLEGCSGSALFRRFQIYSNHIAIISMALKEACVTQASLNAALSSVGPLKNGADDLQDRLFEPLVRNRPFTPEEIRGLHGSVFKNRELLVQLQLKVLYPPHT